jgi:uncharacterized protein YwqG
VYYSNRPVLRFNHRTKLLGHSNNVQGPMEFECALITAGYQWKDIKNEQINQAVKALQSEWVLLFQLDSEPATGMCWGDVGRLYFWIREADLRSGLFEKTWLILQCY